MQEALQQVYSELLDRATHLTMNDGDGDDIFYDMLDSALEAAQNSRRLNK